MWPLGAYVRCGAGGADGRRGHHPARPRRLGRPRRRDDVWVYGTHRRRWSRLQTEGCTPPPRALHAACLLGDEFVVTGGWNGGEAQHADVWALTLTPDACRWAPLTVDAEVASPGARQAHSVVGSSASELVLFGGDAGGGLCNDLWSLDSAL